jgi:hypothetical protein
MFSEHPRRRTGATKVVAPRAATRKALLSRPQKKSGKPSLRGAAGDEAISNRLTLLSRACFAALAMTESEDFFSGLLKENLSGN